jgi:hypothetical protein
LLGLFFGPEDGGDMFLGNVGWILMGYTALYSKDRTHNHRYENLRSYMNESQLAVAGVGFWSRSEDDDKARILIEVGSSLITGRHKYVYQYHVGSYRIREYKMT